MKIHINAIAVVSVSMPTLVKTLATARSFKATLTIETKGDNEPQVVCLDAHRKKCEPIDAQRSHLET